MSSIYEKIKQEKKVEVNSKRARQGKVESKSQKRGGFMERVGDGWIEEECKGRRGGRDKWEIK